MELVELGNTRILINYAQKSPWTLGQTCGELREDKLCLFLKGCRASIYGHAHNSYMLH